MYIVLSLKICFKTRKVEKRSKKCEFTVKQVVVNSKGLNKSVEEHGNQTVFW